MINHKTHEEMVEVTLHLQSRDKYFLNVDDTWLALKLRIHATVVA